jgi:hypothetical protein
MKRVKIMLMCICLVAAAGGILAFKARSPQRFCIAFTVNNTCPALCPNLAWIITTAARGSIICTAVPYVHSPNQYTCTFLQGGFTQTVECEGTTRITNTEL